MILRGLDFPIYLVIFRSVYRVFQKDNLVHEMRKQLYNYFIIAGGVLVLSTIGVR